MEQDNTSKKYRVIDQFDEILFKHLERLIGSKHGIGELDLNSVSISIIVLLMERENEIESFPSDEIDRYTHGTLTDDIQEMGLDAVQDLNIVVEEMIRKSYIHVDDANSLVPQKPTISMARLIDAVFPKMPGMNLVAYFVQAMDEVKSNRKDLDSAMSQFDQVLHMQGVPLKKGPRQSESSKVPVQHDDNTASIHNLDKSPQNDKIQSSDKELIAPVILGRNPSNNRLDPSKPSLIKPKVLSSDAYKGKVKITKIDFGRPDLKEVGPDKTHSDEHEHLEDKELEAGAKLVETQQSDDAESKNFDTRMTASSGEPPKTVVDEQNQRFESSATEMLLHDSVSSVQYTACDLNSGEKDKSNFTDKEGPLINDDDIEKRIKAFEEDLALECPICKHSRVMVERTATGKSYYKCLNRECTFISWGKPHHIICPKCNNPFLIEATNKSDTTILKCPRATCRYWEKSRMDSSTPASGKIASISQKPRKKVVRRRVVRRKR
ncbi:MAG: hypothetical protein P8012_06805 [Desulfobacterales bacterium]